MSDFDPVEMAARNTALAVKLAAAEAERDLLEGDYAGLLLRWEEALTKPYPAAGVMREPAESLYRRTEKIREERDEIQRVFDLMWAADMRAIKAWREAIPGNDAVWPDRAKLTTWLIERAEKAETETATLRKVANALVVVVDAYQSLLITEEDMFATIAEIKADGDAVSAHKHPIPFNHKDEP